jgi:hypothetical protein
MSALPPKADIAKRRWDVRFVPKADITRRRMDMDEGTSSPVPCGLNNQIEIDSAAAASDRAEDYQRWYQPYRYPRYPP